MVPASATSPTTTTGGFHTPVPWRAVGFGDSHPAPMPGSCLTTQDTEITGPTLQGCIGTISVVLWLCVKLGIQINLPISDLVPS
ncbi:hypothetical protein E2C01_091545 [Portunus trituberculatus]|uniref:Uncharacterized protein n=1 Tax=Portunus trituberculatus TaxID=210409 RepID=A0A5B7JVB5_PORTR|nr:hypothetical protein [Portunus trituberculatus]